MSPGEDWVDDLYSKLPYRRLAAARMLVRNADQINTAELISLMQKESVQQIRNVFERVVEQRTINGENQVFSDAGTGDSTTENAGEIRHLIATVRHELRPIVGRIRSRASKEMINFEDSRTSKEIDALREKIESFESLLLPDDELYIEAIDLRTLLEDCCRGDDALIAISSEQAGASPEIYTDRSLFDTMLDNIYRNSLEAASETPDHHIDVRWGSTNLDFWISVSNRFNGVSFDKGELLGRGRSSKKQHDGIGMATIDHIASRLGLQYKIEGTSGIAISTIGGRLRYQ